MSKAIVMVYVDAYTRMSNMSKAVLSYPYNASKSLYFWSWADCGITQLYCQGHTHDTVKTALTDHCHQTTYRERPNIPGRRFYNFNVNEPVAKDRLS